MATEPFVHELDVAIEEADRDLPHGFRVLTITRQGSGWSLVAEGTVKETPFRVNGEAETLGSILWAMRDHINKLVRDFS